MSLHIRGGGGRDKKKKRKEKRGFQMVTFVVKTLYIFTHKKSRYARPNTHFAFILGVYNLANGVICHSVGVQTLIPRWWHKSNFKQYYQTAKTMWVLRNWRCLATSEIVEVKILLRHKWSRKVYSTIGC